MRRIDALDKFLDVSMRHKIYTENLKNLKAKLSALKNEIDLHSASDRAITFLQEDF